MERGNRNKGTAVAFAILSLFTAGFIQVHKLYLKEITSFCLRCILAITGISIILLIIDIFRLAFMPNSQFDKLYNNKQVILNECDTHEEIVAKLKELKRHKVAYENYIEEESKN